MSAATEAALEKVATTARLLVALDFDGTLSVHCDDPMQARMVPGARDALDALVGAPETAVALVSGRSMSDLKIISEHTDDSRIHLAGSHGAEFWHPGTGDVTTADDEDAAVRDELIARTEAAIAEVPGSWIEHKAVGFGLHTRGLSADDEARAQEIVDDVVAKNAPGWRRRKGQHILEFAYRQEGKDSAVAALRDSLSASAVVFAGDDVTDEDALRSLGADDFGIHVGAGETAATITVGDPVELAGLLARLAQLRDAR